MTSVEFMERFWTGLSIFAAVLLLVAILALIVYRFVQFWVGFAQGWTEASPKPRGFEVQEVTAAPSQPVRAQPFDTAAGVRCPPGSE